MSWCASCGDALDPADAITVEGVSFHDACYGSERFGASSGPWLYDDEPAPALDAAESALFHVIAARGLEVVGYV